MDPDAALEDIRGLTGRETLSTADAVELAWAFASLDEWLSMGGFLPAAWEDVRKLADRPSEATSLSHRCICGGRLEPRVLGSRARPEVKLICDKQWSDGIHRPIRCVGCAYQDCIRCDCDCHEGV